MPYPKPAPLRLGVREPDEKPVRLLDRVRSLRDPSRLARLARDRDLGWPERVIELGPEVGGPRP